jgi:hypothetical protein
MNTDVGFIPKKYYEKLSSTDKKKQVKYLKKSRKAYKKGEYIDRPKFDSYVNKKSKYIIAFTKAYDVSIMETDKVKKATGVSKKAQERILAKGRGAYYSSGSRPGQSAASWAYARLASVIMNGPARKIDQHILNEEKIVIKKPVKKTKKSKKLKK